MGPRAWKADVEMEIVEALAGDLGGAKLGGGSRVTAGTIGGGQLGHHELPRGLPGSADGGHEEPRRERWAPEEVRD